MRILQVSLGLPPFRTGGLTNYCYDLMKCLQDKEHEVLLLYPGHFSILPGTRISKGNESGFITFEIINPLPVSLIGGIKQPGFFHREVNIDIYKKFLDKINPDIIHVHTIMGIHKEFFKACRELGVKMVFTTHDYFGICPKTTLMDMHGKVCSDNCDCKKCVKCNNQAYSPRMIYFMQSKLYRRFKNHRLLKIISGIKKNHFKHKSIQKPNNTINAEKVEEYRRLSQYHMSIYNMVDYFHYNSPLTKEIYEKYLKKEGEVIEITHSLIKDNRKVKNISLENIPLQIGYLGPISEYKGFYLLVDALNSLKKKGINNWVLNIYGDMPTKEMSNNNDSFRFYGRYKRTDLGKILETVDVIIVPSIWKETFGLVALEALSFGTPVLVSENVGAKFILQRYGQDTVFPATLIGIEKVIKKAIENRKWLESVNHSIVNGDYHFDMDIHTDKIISLYKLLKERDR